MKKFYEPSNLERIAGAVVVAGAVNGLKIAVGMYHLAMNMYDRMTHNDSPGILEETAVRSYKGLAMSPIDSEKYVALTKLVNSNRK